MGRKEPGNEAKLSPPNNDLLQISANWTSEVENYTKSCALIIYIYHSTKLYGKILQVCCHLYCCRVGSKANNRAVWDSNLGFVYSSARA